MRFFYLFSIFILTICFMACDGQERMHKSPQEILQENKLLDSFSENIIYTPLNYNVVENDTLFSSGHRVLIKYYTDMENNILVSNLEDGKNHKHYYREFAVNILITKGDKVYFDETIDKDFLIKSNNLIDGTLNDKYLKNVWVQDSDKDLKDKPIFNIEFFSPTTSESIIYKFIVSENTYLILKSPEKE